MHPNQSTIGESEVLTITLLSPKMFKEVNSTFFKGFFKGVRISS